MIHGSWLLTDNGSRLTINGYYQSFTIKREPLTDVVNFIPLIGIRETHYISFL